jgi:hypothetical protein
MMMIIMIITFSQMTAISASSRAVRRADLTEMKTLARDAVGIIRISGRDKRRIYEEYMEVMD